MSYSIPVGHRLALLNQIYQKNPEALKSIGDGLSLTGTIISVNTDDTTIEIDSGEVAIKDSGVGAGQIGVDQVNKTHISDNIAGAGIIQATDGALEVNDDNSTLEINADVLRVKDAGITDDKLALDYIQFRSGTKDELDAAEPGVAYLGVDTGVPYIYICREADWVAAGVHWARGTLSAAW
jgi:hypothetical protein